VSGSVLPTMNKSFICKESQKFTPLVNRQLRHSLRLFLSLTPHMMPPLLTPGDKKSDPFFSLRSQYLRQCFFPGKQLVARRGNDPLRHKRRDAEVFQTAPYIERLVYTYLPKTILDLSASSVRGILRGSALTRRKLRFRIGVMAEMSSVKRYIASSSLFLDF